MPRNYRHLSKRLQHSLISKAISKLVAALLYVHRCFFAEAVSNNPTDPMSSPFAPSFLAGYRSACELISGLPAQFDLFPAQIARFWVLWTHAFSSSMSTPRQNNRLECHVDAPTYLGDAVFCCYACIWKWFSVQDHYRSLDRAATCCQSFQRSISFRRSSWKIPCTSALAN
jgi:hypothetical protein